MEVQDEGGRPQIDGIRARDDLVVVAVYVILSTADGTDKGHAGPLRTLQVSRPPLGTNTVVRTYTYGRDAPLRRSSARRDPSKGGRSRVPRRDEPDGRSSGLKIILRNKIATDDGANRRENDARAKGSFNDGSEECFEYGDRVRGEPVEYRRPAKR